MDGRETVRLIGCKEHQLYHYKKNNIQNHRFKKTYDAHLFLKP